MGYYDLSPADRGRTMASVKAAGLCQFGSNAQIATGTKTDRAMSIAGFTSMKATDLEATARASTSKFVTPANLAAEGFLRFADVTITSAQILLLATTPIELVAAPGAAKALMFMGAFLKLDYGTNVFTEAADNLGIKYTDASGVQVCTTVETTGFIDASADTYTNAVPIADAIVVATGADNKALVLDNLNANFGGNAGDDSALVVRTFFQVVAI